VYLFNLCGYSLLFNYFIHQSEQHFVQQLDLNNYHESELVEIIIPLHLPYMQSTQSFERIDGSIENNGVHYTYVKRKVQHDTMFIMCIANSQKTLLVKATSKYAGEVNDFATNKDDKKSSAKKISSSNEYHNIVSQYNFSVSKLITCLYCYTLSCCLYTTLKDTPEHPPKAIC